ncbi:MAG: hypothetical protein HHAS10_00300 [Candidatus Altimarinota bacterium]
MMKPNGFIIFLEKCHTFFFSSSFYNERKSSIFTLLFMKKYIFLLGLFAFPVFASASDIVVCTMEYAPVCGQPPMPLCPTGMACIQSFPAPKTYSNTCMMKADNAALIHTGECESVNTPKACTKEYMPVCGMKQVQCFTTPCNPIRTDYGNRCMAEADGATDITYGTCQMSEGNPPVVGGDKDKYGCIPSAGYTWDESLKSCIRPWEYQDKVDWAYNKKITKYTSINEFKYGNILTRQEAAAFITRYLIEGLGRSEALCKLSYKDLSSIDTSLTPSISRACGLGVMLGDRGYFHPRRGLTRAEALAVLIRAIDQKRRDESLFPWYQNYITRANELGLSLPNKPENFNQFITRGEFIEWLKTLSENQTGTNDTTLLGDWKLEGYTDAKGKEYSVSPTTLTFTANRFSAKFCNSISGEYSAKDGMITAKSVMSTMMACADDTLTMLEGAFDLDGATYSVMIASVMPGYTGPTMWVNIRTSAGATYRFGR